MRVWRVVGAVAGAIALGCTVNPVTGRFQLDLMGEVQEVMLGQELYRRYTQSSLGEVDDPELQGDVDGVGGKLAAVSHWPGLESRHNAVNDPAVNAYALPGGKVSITRGLLAPAESETARRAAQRLQALGALDGPVQGGTP